MGQFVLNFSKDMRKKDKRVRPTESNNNPHVTCSESQPEKYEDILNVGEGESATVLNMV